jgi:hypothetical protein
VSPRPSPLDRDAFFALANKGSSLCLPGKPCGMLVAVIDETARTAPAKGCPGLERYFTAKEEEGVAYRVAPRGPLLVINQCPWCGASPWKAGGK